MREIKFKFWIGHTKKMTHDHTLKEVGYVIKEFTDDIIPLQYTGLKDKNGKEIYEGDIVKVFEQDDIFEIDFKPYAVMLEREWSIGTMVTVIIATMK